MAARNPRSQKGKHKAEPGGPRSKRVLAEPRYPIEPLMELARCATIAEFALAAGITEDNARKLKERGVIWSRADELATTFGRYAGNVWPEWAMRDPSEWCLVPDESGNYQPLLLVEPTATYWQAPRSPEVDAGLVWFRSELDAFAGSFDPADAAPEPPVGDQASAEVGFGDGVSQPLDASWWSAAAADRTSSAARARSRVGAAGSTGRPWGGPTVDGTAGTPRHRPPRH